jgi:hypothetical protein
LTEIEKTLLKLDSLLKANSIDYVVIGGTAAIIYGRLRTTEDIDITLLSELENFDMLYNLISTHYSPILSDPENFFKKNYVLPVMDTETSVKIDFAAGLSGFDKKVLERKVIRKFGTIEINICSIEDLIIYKLVSARPQDLLDIEELIKANKETLDIIYLKKMAENFIEVERGDVLDNLNKYLAKSKS